MTGASGIIAKAFGNKSTNAISPYVAAPKPAAKPAAKPTKPTKSKVKVKKSETKVSKPADLALGANEQLAINTLEGQAATSAALRQYQEEAAKRNLQQSLKTIDRGALDLYKGVSDDYAGRGMLRTGGYVQADDRAYQGVQDQKISMQNSLMDLLRQNEIESAGEAETLTNQKTDIMQKFLQALMANKTAQIRQ
jgi:hypothetical protein